MITELYLHQIQIAAQNLIRYSVLCWPFILVPVAISLIHFDAHPFRRETWVRLFPSTLYLHRSSRQDYGIIAINAFFSIFVFSFILVLFDWLDLEGKLRTLLNRPPFELTPSLGLDLAYTLWIFMAVDFAGYVLHRLQHRVPFLWEIHRVHHSAEALTPFTSGRIHPLEGGMNTIGLAIAFVGASTSFRCLFVADAQQVLVNGLDVLTFAGLMLFGHLKHSHVWITLPSALSRVVISPAMHQIHHSSRPQHIDRNLGAFLSIWDGLFGTLYLPKDQDRTELALGVSEREPNPYRSLREIYWGSLISSWRVVRSKGPKPESSARAS